MADKQVNAKGKPISGDAGQGVQKSGSSGAVTSEKGGKPTGAPSTKNEAPIVGKPNTIDSVPQREVTRQAVKDDKNTSKVIVADSDPADLAPQAAVSVDQVGAAVGSAVPIPTAPTYVKQTKLVDFKRIKVAVRNPGIELQATELGSLDGRSLSSKGADYGIAVSKPSVLGTMARPSTDIEWLSIIIGVTGLNHNSGRDTTVNPDQLIEANYGTDGELKGWVTLRDMPIPYANAFYNGSAASKTVANLALKDREGNAIYRGVAVYKDRVPESSVNPQRGYITSKRYFRGLKKFVDRYLSAQMRVPYEGRKLMTKDFASAEELVKYLHFVFTDNTMFLSTWQHLFNMKAIMTMIKNLGGLAPGEDAFIKTFIEAINTADAPYKLQQAQEYFGDSLPHFKSMEFYKQVAGLWSLSSSEEGKMLTGIDVTMAPTYHPDVIKSFGGGYEYVTRRGYTNEPVTVKHYSLYSRLLLLVDRYSAGSYKNKSGTQLQFSSD